MKKRILLFSMMGFVAIKLFSQSPITITESDFGNVGDSLFMGYDNTPGIPTLPINLIPSQKQIWNFDTLNATPANVLKVKFEDPSNYVNASVFTGSNMVLSKTFPNLMGYKYFMNKNANDISLIGRPNGLMLFLGSLGSFVKDLVYSPPIKQIVFPATIGTTYTGVSSFEFKEYIGYYNVNLPNYNCGDSVKIDSVWFKRTVLYDINFDAFGDLKLLGWHYNTLRSLNKNIIVDSIRLFLSDTLICFSNLSQFSDLYTPTLGWNSGPDIYYVLKAFGSTSNTVNYDTIIEYNWYDDSTNYNLCKINVNSSYLPQFVYYQLDSSRIGLSVNNFDFDNSISLFPNPTSDFLNVRVFNNLETFKDFDIQITDISGRNLIRRKLNENNIQFDLRELKNGVYFINFLKNNISIYSNKIIYIGKSK